MNDSCQQCNARCCRYFCFEIDKPDTYEDFEDIRWYLLHQGIRIHIDDDGDWCIEILNVCLNLVEAAEGFRCKDYGNRPLICRKYSPETCDFTEGPYEYEEYFTSAEQLDEYARRMLGEDAYEEAKLRARRKFKRDLQTPRRQDRET